MFSRRCDASDPARSTSVWRTIQEAQRMTFTHVEILDAVRIAGRDGQVFGCAAVREQLQVSTRNRRELSKFHRRFKAFQNAAPDEIQRVGNNLYRLKGASPTSALELTAVPFEQNAEPEQPQASVAPAIFAALTESITPAPSLDVTPEPPVEVDTSVHTMVFAELSQGELDNAIDLGLDEALKGQLIQAPAQTAAAVSGEMPAPPLPARSLRPSRAFSDELSTAVMTLDVSRDGVVLAPETGADVLGFVELSEPISEAEAAAEEAAFAGFSLNGAASLHAADTMGMEPIRSFADVRIAPSRRTAAARARVTSSFEQAQVLLARSLRQRGSWLGRRVAELLHLA
jgi:hypothetical protein